MADTERNKQTVARLFEAFRAGEVDTFDDLIVDAYVQHDLPQAETASGGERLLRPRRAGRRRGAPRDRRRRPRRRPLQLKPWNIAGVDIFRFNHDGKIIENGASSSRCRKRPRAETTCSRSSRRSSADAAPRRPCTSTVPTSKPRRRPRTRSGSRVCFSVATSDN